MTSDQGQVAKDREPRLVRRLGLLDATMIVAGSMVGSGIFIVSAESARLLGSPGWLMVAWALAGVLTITGALSCAELSAMMPRAGGQYVFLREAFGAPIGFLFGWATFLVVQTGTIAAVAVAFAKFLGVFVPNVNESNYVFGPFLLGKSGLALALSAQQIVAVAVILGLTLANTRGLETGRWVQNVMTITKLLALLALVVLGLGWGWNRGSAAYTSSWWHPAANGWNAAQVEPGLKVVGSLALVMLLGKAMIGPLFAQTAWNNVTFTGGETHEPHRTLPRALALGASMVVVIYMLANIAYLVTLPFDQIQNAPNERVGTVTMEVILGKAGLYAMAAAILVSTFGCVNGIVLAGARVYYAMARDGLFFRSVGSINAKHVPAVALWTQGLWATLLVLPRTVTWPHGPDHPEFGSLYNKLLEYVTSADLTFSALMVAAVLVLRWKAPGAERPYRTPGYPVPMLIYVGLALLLIGDWAILNPLTSGAGFLIVISGIPVYFLWRALGRGPEKR